MTTLTITSAPALGPLEVSVYPPEGDPVEFTLSSALTQKTVPALRPGRYTVVARRPNGARLRQSAQVGGEDASVSLSDAIGDTPNEFMQRETERGDIAEKATDPEPPRFGAPLSGVFADILGRAMLVQGFSGAPPRRKRPSRTKPSEAKSLVVRGWRFGGSRWLAIAPESQAPLGKINQSGEFLKLTINAQPVGSGQIGDILCFGLLDQSGFGPLVIVPPFTVPVELTFVAKGVSARADDRATSPGQQRVPVALFTPGDHAVADFLSALAAPAPASAEALWNQVAPSLAGGETAVAQALDALFLKFERPVEALAAAHFVLRFMPNRLPVQWAENLVRVQPLLSDGPVISAWAMIYNRPANATDAEVDAAVARNVALALERPITAFARSRALLFEARHLVPDDATAQSRWQAEETFRRAGAAAGGLESYWGKAPDAPGSDGQAQPGPGLKTLFLDGQVFR